MCVHMMKCCFFHSFSDEIKRETERIHKLSSFFFHDTNKQARFSRVITKNFFNRLCTKRKCEKKKYFNVFCFVQFTRQWQDDHFENVRKIFYSIFELQAFMNYYSRHVSYDSAEITNCVYRITFILNSFTIKLSLFITVTSSSFPYRKLHFENVCTNAFETFLQTNKNEDRSWTIFKPIMRILNKSSKHP